ncbi:hypothetical protein GSI_00359 [Ganoderma sinense ZZ0214-1]|uniref:Uncharacterized protein n=1 Tax=Ganoderma sinense ZZ0214-1 TaxID=1077348 RepID=A0A2G8SSD6_9APHY|nr:hypothetical protein GSI_00359 [Ganoderma sinense ZZ0214-1]
MTSSNLLPSDTSRLPSYRSTHVGRFHPYPRGGPRRREDALMQTVDHRTADHVTGLPTIPEEPEPEPVRLRPLVVCQEVPDGDVSSLELDCPVVGDVSFFEQQGVRAEDDVGEKVKVAVAHLFVAIRRRSLALLAVMDLLKGEHRMK